MCALVIVLVSTCETGKGHSPPTHREPPSSFSWTPNTSYIFESLEDWTCELKLCVCVYSKLQITYFSVVLVNFGNLATSFHLDSCCWVLTVIYVQYYMFFFLVAAGRSSSLPFQPLSILLTSSWATFTSRVSTDDTLLHVITHLTITAASLPHS